MSRYCEKLRHLVGASPCSYQESDLKIDQAALDRLDAPDARWLWVLRPTGTELVRLHVHPKTSMWGFSALKTGDPAPYLLSGGTVRQVSMERARELLDRIDYRMLNQAIWRDKQRLASLMLTGEWDRGASMHRMVAKVEPHTDLDLDDLTAIREVAIGESAAKAGTLFCHITVDVTGLEINALIQAMRDGTAQACGQAKAIA